MVGQSLPVRASGPALACDRGAGSRRTVGRLILNLTAFQAGWLAAVLGAAQGLAWLGPTAAALAIALHLGMAHRPSREVRLLLAAVVVGVILEQVLLLAGYTHYPGDPRWVPIWMIAFWPLFATTLNVSLAWLKPRRRLAVIAGAVAGPLAYAAGEALGAIRLEGHALPAIALGWAVALPLLLALASRWNGCVAAREIGA